MAETAVQQAIRARLSRSPTVSKRALAKEIGVKPDTLIAWERGTSPRDYQLVKMASALEVSIDDLREEALTGEVSPLPVEVAVTLRRLADLAEVVPALKELCEKAPDLMQALADARDRAGEFSL